MKHVMMKKAAPIMLWLAWSFAPALGQHAHVDTLLKKFNDFREVTLQEKVFAHVNQNFFLTGETLWFKVYVVDGTEHRPLDMSKVAYAEVLDKTNFPVLQTKIKLTDGRGDGSFFLPASLSSGQYKLRVYTSWMKNFSPEYYFDETFSLVNPFVAPDPITKSTTTYSIDFFPEGGNLVSGIRSKIAFRIHDGSGKSANTKGWIVNNQNDTIASFRAERFGIGHFYMTPFADKQYKAVLANTGAKSYAFPKVHPAGYVMQLEDSGDFIRVAVHASGAERGTILLFAHARQQIINAQAKVLQGKTIFEIPKANMVGGIAHFTLFNAGLQPLCERLYFTYPKRELTIDITTNQKVFSPRRKVSVTLNTGASASLASANLSMSVYKVDSLSNENVTHIYPYLWLTSDLTGRIESPEYYFTGQSPEVVAAMDNLMLTHGWRRFEWEDVISERHEIEYLPEVKEHIVTASVTKDGQPIRGVFTYLASPGKIIRVYGSWSNDKGLARFEIKDFYGQRRVILQLPEPDPANTPVPSSPPEFQRRQEPANSPVPELAEGTAVPGPELAEGSGPGGTQGYIITINDPFSASMDTEKLSDLQLAEASRHNLVARSIAMQVQDIFYYDQWASQIEQPQVDSSAFYGRADATYYLDDYTRFPVMEEVMREYVPGVFVRKRKDGFHFIVLNGFSGGVLYGDPMVLVDGVPVLDVDDVMRMDPLRVKKLEVVTRRYFLGHSTFPGIVSYTTYNGDLGGLELDAGAVSLNYEGLQLKRKFFKPEHLRVNAADRMPDQRYLLHWEPNINIDKDGTTKVEFYTSDVPGQYRIVVEGLDENGYSGSRSDTFTVKAADNQ